VTGIEPSRRLPSRRVWTSGSAPDLVDSLPVRIRPRWKDQHHAHSVSQGVPFFSLLQKNVLNRRRCAIRDELRLAIVVLIETTYHRRRRQDALGRLTPIEFETLHQTARAA
jgi:hypothetical protein